MLVQNGADSNTVIGNQAGKAISTGGDNTFVGTNSGLSLQSGAQNVAIGAFAFDAANSDESHNVAIGCAAMGAADGTDVENCVVIGHSALSAAATHATEIAIGEDAMLSWTGAGTGGGSATAGYNIAIGGNALDANVSGARNIAIGFDALGIMNANNNSQTQNVAIGHDAGNTISTGTDNVCIGYGADTGAADSVNQIAIGSGVTGIDVDNSVTLGNADVTEVYCASDKGASLYAAQCVVTTGINFPDDASANPSADANTLDNYEEGTWTPQVSGNSGDATMHGSYKHGEYVKIGSFVSVTGYFVVSDTNSCGDDVKIDDLPFTNGDSIGNHNACPVMGHSSLNASTAGFSLMGNIDTNTTSMLLKLYDGTGDVSGLTESELSDGATISFSGTYITA